MRALPIPTARPGTGRALPTPVVKSNVVRQAVDMKPQGNTVAITTVADNPFEARQKVTVHTQASGGMSPAPRSMQSRRIQHSMLPGLGQSSTEEQAKDPSAMDYLKTITDAASDIYSTREGTRTEEARSRAAKAEAEARAAEAAAQQSRAEADKLMASISSGGRRAYEATNVTIPGTGVSVNWAMLGLGAAGLGLAFYLSRRKKK